MASLVFQPRWLPGSMLIYQRVKGFTWLYLYRYSGQMQVRGSPIGSTPEVPLNTTEPRCDWWRFPRCPAIFKSYRSSNGRLADSTVPLEPLESLTGGAFLGSKLWSPPQSDVDVEREDLIPSIFQVYSKYCTTSFHHGISCLHHLRQNVWDTDTLDIFGW